MKCMRAILDLTSRPVVRQRTGFRVAIWTAVILLLGVGSAPWLSNASPLTPVGNPTGQIWSYENQMAPSPEPLLLRLEKQQWQALAAVSLVPAFIGRGHNVPLIFHDVPDNVTLPFPHQERTVASWGSTAATATQAMALEYWTRAEVGFVVKTYEEALWIVPSASFLGAPILVAPSDGLLNDLSTRLLITVGQADDASWTLELETLCLESPEEVWDFQLDLLATKGVGADYLVMTNPHDTDDQTDPNIEWAYLSPVAAPLAAYRRAIVLTGDWSVSRTAVDALEAASQPVADKYSTVRKVTDQVKEDSHAALTQMVNSGHGPRYLAAVGGPYALPNHFYDMHVDYHYPDGNPQVTQYPSSLAAYATLAETVPDDRYIKEDLAAGRIAAATLLDAALQLTRTFHYREYLPGGAYAALAQEDWELTANIVDGHRLNQPEPNNLYWDPVVPYHPYEGISAAWTEGGLNWTYRLPRNSSDHDDTNLTIWGHLNASTSGGYLHLMPHGGMTSLRIEVGYDTTQPDETQRQSVQLTSAEVAQMNFSAPTVVYTTCCKGGVWMHDDGYVPADFMPSAFIHAGAVAYIATPEIQSTCFWKGAPNGTATDQAIHFWERLLEDNVPIGVALNEAKWEAHETWKDDLRGEDNLTHEVDGLMYTLWGDPALEPYKPEVGYEDEKEMDVEISFDREPVGSRSFTLNVTIMDLMTGGSVAGAQVRIDFGDVTQVAPGTELKAPKQGGEYPLTIEVSKDGYRTLTVTDWVVVEGETDDDADSAADTWALVIMIVLALFAMLAYVGGILRTGKG